MHHKAAQRIAALYHLGNIIAPLKKVEGGLLHRMWQLTTDKGDYAIKQLNPDIMQKSGVRAEYEISEQIAKQFAEQGIPAP